MMQHTRQQIIDHLQANRMATSIELSRALLVTAANIRHHLGLLKDAGLVEEVGREPVRGRGRPMKVFRLTEKALMGSLDPLTGALLKTLLSNQDDPTPQLVKIAHNLLDDFQPATNMHSRLKETVEKLNQMKYQGGWEASPNGPRIILRNCPYASILSNHPELCQLDAVLLTLMIDKQVEQISKLERSPDGSPHCAFITSTTESGLSKGRV